LLRLYLTCLSEEKQLIKIHDVQELVNLNEADAKKRVEELKKI
jgi:hypothetical protein